MIEGPLRRTPISYTCASIELSSIRIRRRCCRHSSTEAGESKSNCRIRCCCHSRSHTPKRYLSDCIRNGLLIIHSC